MFLHTNLFLAPRNTTRDTAFVVEGLDPCELYSYSVVVISELYGLGPLVDPIVFVTPYDANAPPRRFQVSQSDKNPIMMHIYFEASCPQHPQSAYEVCDLIKHLKQPQFNQMHNTP